MPKQLNTVIDSIQYVDSQYIDTSLQPWCPLEHTPYESLCLNEYHNVQLRSDEPCSHTTECFNAKARLNAHKTK